MSSSAPARRAARRIAGSSSSVRDRAEADVVGDWQLVVDEVLEDRRDHAPPAREVELADVDAVDGDAARRRLVEARRAA